MLDDVARRRVRTKSGIEIALRDWGGDGPLALLHHANGFCAELWAQVAERLRGRFHLIALDARGHGASSKPDPEGDCPVYTAMSGQERWQPTLAASSFAQFLRILATAMEIAQGFGDAIMDDEDEDSFREALGPKVKVIDAAALRAGHWT